MNRASASAILFILTLSVHAGAQTPAPRTVSVADYVAWLDRLAAALDQGDSAPGELTRDVPAGWRVQGNDRTFDISNTWLLNDLRELQSRPAPFARTRLVALLRMTGAEASAYGVPPTAPLGSRSALDAILDRREFRNIHGPTWIDQLRQRVLRWVLNVMDLVFGSSAVPTVSTVLVYVLIALAVVALAAWTYRSLTNSAALDTIVPDRQPVSAKEWSIWLAEAQQAGGRGHWRDAIHLAYWCAVSFLESQGAWRPDRARTPREYLRLLPSASEHRPALTALTHSFELVWYGTDQADARSFADALAHLERLGCRVA